MRALADETRIRRFLRALGREAEEGTAYLTGGVTAVLFGWRGTTIDVDLKLVPENERTLRALARLKDELEINVELASPADFIPVPSGWEERSPFAASEGRLTYRHFDLDAQALAKLERAHTRDRADVEAMFERRLIEPAALLAYFERVEPELYRFPAIDPASFRRRVEEACR
jgi:hypothetical protein